MLIRINPSSNDSSNRRGGGMPSTYIGQVWVIFNFMLCYYSLIRSGSPVCARSAR